MENVNSIEGSVDPEFELWEEMKEYAVEQLHENLNDLQELRRFAAARVLQVRGGADSFLHAKSLLEGDAQSREIGAFLLGQLGTPEKPFLEDSYPILESLLIHDDVPKVRAAAAAALGHLASAHSFDVLANAVQDVSSDVRVGVAFALGKLGISRAIDPLLKLTHDEDLEVVEWALVALRLLDKRSVLIADRFAAFLTDSREEIFEEAVSGLAEQKDPRVFSTISNALSQDNVSCNIIEAAGNLGDPRLLPQLIELSNNLENSSLKGLQNAIGQLRERKD